MTNGKTDLKASISITVPSSTARVLQGNLSSNWTPKRNSNVFAFMYGTGLEIDNVKQTNGQMEANNYIYSPSVQTGQFKITEPGNYTVQFDVPYVVPPLSASISASADTDAYIAFTSRFGMTITVIAGSSDVISWTVNGQVGAANSEFLGDALYNNFGTVLQLPRFGNTIIDTSFVSKYTSVGKFLNVTKLLPVQDFTAQISNPTTPVTSPIALNPPLNQGNVIRGRLQKTEAVTSPSASHELLDVNGNVLAFLNFEVSNFPYNSIGTLTDSTSAFIWNNLESKTCPIDTINPLNPNNVVSQSNATKSTFDVYVEGSIVDFVFDPWKQLPYVQETFRADNEYRRFLSGLNRSLTIGPTIDGLSNLVSTIFAQPHIPSKQWDESDYRVFNTPTPPQTQYTGTIGTPPTVHVLQVENTWTPETLTYNNRPPTTIISDVPKVQIKSLNVPTPFNITNEIVRQLRVGIDAPEGGILDWNYLQYLETSDANNQFQVTNIYTNGVVINGQTYPYNYVFLNNANDSIGNLKLFYYKTQYTLSSGINHPTNYLSTQQLTYGRDYTIVNTADLYDAKTNGGLGGFNLPAELLVKYNCNSNLPFIARYAQYSAGTNYINTDATKPPLPASVLLIDLSASGYTQPTNFKFPTNVTDFLIYTYTQVSCTPGVINGSFDTDANNSSLIQYYDSQSALTTQPSDSPFINSNVQLAQGSYARFTSDTGYKFVTSMIAGQITFNKTITVTNLLTHTPNASYGACGIPVLNVTSVTTTTQASSNSTGAFFRVPGKLVKNTFLGNPYYQIDTAPYILIDQYNFPVALIDPSTLYNVQQYLNDPTIRLYSGLVGSMIWDTRIPVADYQDTSPVFQVSDNFDTEITPFTPNVNVPTVALPVNKNFLALIHGVPLGNQQTITASWTFNVIQQKSQSLVNQLNNTIPILAFPDLPSQPGIMSYFTGKVLIKNLGSEPDSAAYTQTYVSPAFEAYFLGYKDYINSNYGGNGFGRLGTNGDGENFDTVFNNYTTPNNMATVLNFFSPGVGIFSLSIIPGMEFYQPSNNAIVKITRPRNNGIALQIERPSYAGLVFYGQGKDESIDKPTRLLLDFSYSATNGANRHRILEVGTTHTAGWVDGSYPDTPVSTKNGSTFYLAGNQFKYSAFGYDQAINNLTINANGTSSSASLIVGTQYSLNSAPPAYEYRPSDNIATPGIPQRYRRPPEYIIDASGNEVLNTTYYNVTPEKLAYFKFGLEELPLDTLLSAANLELFFCSGFTIHEALDKNMSLGHNNLWNRSRLSGNGKTQQVTLKDQSGNPLLLNGSAVSVIRPLNNVHWRKNFFDIVIPYSFTSNLNYNLSNIFNPSTVDLFSQTIPQSGLEYLGFINLNEIGVKATNLTNTTFFEETQGLTNLILSSSSVVWQIVVGTLTEDSLGRPNISPWSTTNQNGLPSVDVWAANPQLSTAFRRYQVINQSKILPNMKVIVFPNGINDINNPQNSEFVYGYVTSVLPVSLVDFSPQQITTYKKLFEYIVPLYSEYKVQLLESDTYFPFMTFGRNTTLDGTPQDISY